jgi:CBS domain containing-hemolysin-like protein
MDAQAWLLDAAELLDLDLPSRDYHTLAGFLTSNFGRIPIEGVVVEAYGYPFTVVEGSTRAPHRIRIEPA